MPDDHLAWFGLEAVDELDLSAFYSTYRADDHGRAAHHPSMMVALYIYAYSVGVRSSRAIERRCHEYVAFRVICANQAPDHATIADGPAHGKTLKQHLGPPAPDVIRRRGGPVGCVKSIR